MLEERREKERREGREEWAGRERREEKERRREKERREGRGISMDSPGRTKRRKKRRNCRRRLCFGVFLLSLMLLVLFMTGAHKKQNQEQEDLEIKSVTFVDQPDAAPLSEAVVEEMIGATKEQKERYVSEHPSEYPKDLLELLENNSELLDFVYCYPLRSQLHLACDLTEEADGTIVPLLQQWDIRWGYEPYAGGMIGYTGCGPTCLSMVALFLTGNAEESPAYVAKVAEREGYSVKGVGTSWELLGKGCELFGIQAAELPLDENRMMNELAMGHPIICAMGKGDFTENGHFIVIKGYLGGFLVNDPNSRVRSERTWSFEELRPQIRNLWAYSLKK